MRGHDLRVWRVEVALQEVLKVLQVANLTRNPQSFTIRGPSLVENLYGLITMLASLVEDQVGAYSEASAPLTCFAMDGNHALRVVCQIEHRVED